MNVDQHLTDRYLDRSVHPHVFVDESEGVATFLLYNGGGKPTGFQRYRPYATKKKQNDPKEGRYYTFRNKGELAIFGTETLHFDFPVIFVTEGIFDAVRLTRHRVPCLAILSNDPNTDLRNYLANLMRPIVAVCDSGAEGQKLAKLGDYVVTMITGDLGDATETQVLSIIARHFP